MSTPTKIRKLRPQRGKGLGADNLDEVLRASPKTAQKGGGQFFTPPEYAKAFGYPLTHFRPIVADLNCGRGALLIGAANDTTRTHLGIDNDHGAQSSRRTTIIGNLDEIYPLLHEVKCKFDLLMLNPPFGLKWSRKNIPEPPVRVGGRKIVADSHIDSIYATWLIALDRLSAYGEGYMVAPQPVVERLIEPCETYRHCWMHVVLPNIFGDTRDDRQMAVLYFAKDHDQDRRTAQDNRRVIFPRCTSENVGRIFMQLWRERHYRMNGSAVEHGLQNDTTEERFNAVREEWVRLQKQKRGGTRWNIYLKGNGRIGGYLSAFDKMCGRISPDFANTLSDIRGKRPVELVVLQSQRNALLRAVESDIWRVQPKVLEAVKKAIEDYHHIRTPFTRPRRAMCVAWAEEEGRLKCLEDLDGFTAGQSYDLTSETFLGMKAETRESLKYGEENVLVSGQELMLILTDDLGRRHGFTQYKIDQPERYRQDKENEDAKESSDLFDTIHCFHLLGTLVNHFEMPDVPDIAEVMPERFNENLRRLEALEME